MEKYCRGGQATDENMAHVIVCWISKSTNTYSEYVILIAFFTARMVARTRPNLMFVRNAACLISFYHGATAPSGPGPPHYRSFAIARKHTTIGRTPLDDWSARRRDLYLTTHTNKRQTWLRGIRTRYPSKPEAAGPRLWPRDNLDRPVVHNRKMQSKTTVNTEDISFLSPYSSWVTSCFRG
jgi:hypothetical protein